ncbi:MAG: helix-turn-helix domain-containing protein [Clostridia bacterium]|nr:helix-turn-helix domain-containing protein [Clostridia bacterium]
MSDSISLTLGEKILLFRRRKGYSRTQLADIIGVTVSTIANYENGVTLPDLQKLSSIAEVLGVKLDLLLFKPETEQLNSHIHKSKLTQSQLENMF